MEDLNDWSRKELRALPQRDWRKTSCYDSLLFLPTGKPHDSGWGTITIIGVRDCVPIEIISTGSDDVGLCMDTIKRYSSGLTFARVRMDCLLRSGALRLWSQEGAFTVGPALSSLDVDWTPKETVNG